MYNSCWTCKSGRNKKYGSWFLESVSYSGMLLEHSEAESSSMKTIKFSKEHQKTIRGVKRPELSRHTAALTFLSAIVLRPFPGPPVRSDSVVYHCSTPNSSNTAKLLLLGTPPLCSGFRFSDPLPHLQTVKIIYPRSLYFFFFIICLMAAEDETFSAENTI